MVAVGEVARSVACPMLEVPVLQPSLIPQALACPMLLAVEVD